MAAKNSNGRFKSTPDMFGGLVEELGREATEILRAAEARRQRHVTANGVDYDFYHLIDDGYIDPQ